ncbi:DUF3179 domain-containing protein [Vibrio maritimus]
MRSILPVLSFVFFLLAPSFGLAKSLNGFELNNATVPLNLIQSGGPPRDGIPALTDPKFELGKTAKSVKPRDVVLGLVINGEAKAYPLNILNWHEIVNDTVGGERVLVSYCPLCGSGMAFSSKPQGNEKPELEFGVSGLLYSSDVLMYDRETESLWSQIHGEAVAGALVGSKLKQIPMSLSRWSNWLQRYPDTKVLSTETGYRRDYEGDPYAGYAEHPNLYFPVANQAPSQYHQKEMVLGVLLGDSAVAFPFSELEKQDKMSFEYLLGNQTYTIHWDSHNQSAWITDKDGQTLASTLLFWFAWYAFYPDTQVFSAS